MWARCRAVAPPDTEPCRSQFEVLPAQRNEFGSREGMAISNEYRGGITISPAVLPRGLHQPIDFPLGEVSTAGFARRRRDRRLAVKGCALHGFGPRLVASLQDQLLPGFPRIDTRTAAGRVGTDRSTSKTPTQRLRLGTRVSAEPNTPRPSSLPFRSSPVQMRGTLFGRAN